ncbi:DUF7118 family protein [Halocatena marina]|uniref:DUF7118 family protein n=1 Tax=Halocatena marina TaxID=2934937 RepID=UPI00200FEDCE|nr:hypothetical protein [Halocatena marina]
MDAVDDLRTVANEYENVRERVESIGVQKHEAVSEAYHEILDLFDRYEERATDWDDFEGYVEFQSQLVDAIEGLPDDLPARDAFEAADEHLHQQSLSESDFERARADLQPAAAYADRYERINELREQYHDARYAVRQERDELDERITRLERIKRFGEADLDAPVDRIREPIDRYNETINEDFQAFVQEESARAVLSLVASTAAYPLIEYRQPPESVLEYVKTHPAGTESIPSLLEYAEYSRSKLDHYVENAQALKAAVGTNRTYLNRLDGGPLELVWPPPQAATLQFQVRERISVVGRFAPEETVARLRALRAMSEIPAYDDLRESALARDELNDDARQRLQNGTVERDLEQARTKRDHLDDVLREFSGPE